MGILVWTFEKIPSLVLLLLPLFVKKRGDFSVCDAMFKRNKYYNEKGVQQCSSLYRCDNVLVFHPIRVSAWLDFSASVPLN